VQSNTKGRAPPSSRKQPDSHAIASVAAAMTHLADVIAADTVVPSPERKRKAIEVIEDDGDLSGSEMNKVYKIVRRDTAFADTVLAIRKKTARTSFIHSEIYDSD
jgi:tellurite resistance protein